jgi:hypothetical protein
MTVSPSTAASMADWMVEYWLGTSNSAPRAQVTGMRSVKKIIKITFFIILPFQKVMIKIYDNRLFLRNNPARTKNKNVAGSGMGCQRKA